MIRKDIVIWHPDPPRPLHLHIPGRSAYPVLCLHQGPWGLARLSTYRKESLVERDTGGAAAAWDLS